MSQVEEIVAFRQVGLTWMEIDAIMFPDRPAAVTKKQKNSSPSCIICRKAGAHGLGAFTKKVVGGWGPTQIVVPLRPRVVPMPS